MNAEEAISAKRTLASSLDKEKGKQWEKEKRKREEPSSHDSLGQVRGSPKPPSQRFHNYTSLNTPRSKILMEIQDQLPLAQRMYTPSV